MFDSDAEILEGCKQNDRKSQEQLYNKYVGLFMGICTRYIKNRFEAEDAMMEGFMKIYKGINTFAGNGSFEGWMKRIMVYTAIERYRKLSKMPFDGLQQQDTKVDDNIIDAISARDIIKLMGELPESYRIVLNLNVIEGYSHKEISELMGFAEGTSKSMLYRSKILLKKLIELLIRPIYRL